MRRPLLIIYSWLHHSDATLGQVEAAECSGGREEEHQSSSKLVVHAILSEATLGKFKSKFGDSVTLIETQEP